MDNKKPFWHWIVGVFAAQQQKVANNFIIGYSANHVSAKVAFCDYATEDNSINGM